MAPLGHTSNFTNLPAIVFVWPLLGDCVCMAVARCTLLLGISMYRKDTFDVTAVY